MSRRLRVLYILLICWIAFIWIHSMIPAEASSEESQFIGSLIRPLLEIFTGRGAVTDFIVRKLAHFSEYAVLGMLLSSILLTKSHIADSTMSGLCAFGSADKEPDAVTTSADASADADKNVCPSRTNNAPTVQAEASLYQWSYCLLLVLAVAVTDESIQLITPGRSSQVTDVLIDTSGGLTGILLLRMLSYLADLRKRDIAA